MRLNDSRKKMVYKIPSKKPVDIKDIGVGILSYNRLHYIKDILESIYKYSDGEPTNIFVSDESSDIKVKQYLRSVNWIHLLDHSTRLGVAGQTNRLLDALSSFKYKMIFNDDMLVHHKKWKTFYFDAMVSTKFHHLAYTPTQYENIITDFRKVIINGISFKEIVSKSTFPFGSLLLITQKCQDIVGYFDENIFEKYGWEHCDFSSRVSLSKIQKIGSYDLYDSEKYFTLRGGSDTSVTSKEKRKADRVGKKNFVRKILPLHNRIYVPNSKEQFQDEYNLTKTIDFGKIEICITNKCNFKCKNCDRSCPTAPSTEEMSIEQIDRFISDSKKLDYNWSNIIISGGEPTLHSQLQMILDRLIHSFYPKTKLQMVTNFSNTHILKEIPKEIEILDLRKTNYESSGFIPAQVAPIDKGLYDPNDINICNIPNSCGIALSTTGYYCCAIASNGIDRIFKMNKGIKSLTDVNRNSISKQIPHFCKYCGYYISDMRGNYKRTLKRTKDNIVSESWNEAYRRLKLNETDE